jgi:WD40 repeat protein
MNNGAIYQYGAQDDTLRQLARPSSKTGELCCTAFAAEADFIAAGFTDGSICLHNMEAIPDNGWQPVMVYRCKGHHGCVNAVALSPDGEWLASGGTDGTILLWNAHSGERLHEVGQKASEITALAISPDGALLASGSDQGAVHIWDIHKSRLEWTRTGHHLWIKSLAFSSNGNALASGGYDGRVRLWATHSGHELHAVEHHRTSITSLMYAPDNRTLACGDTQGRINIYDSWTGTLHRWLPACKAAVEEIALSPTPGTGTGFTLACATTNEVSVWSIRLA